MTTTQAASLMKLFQIVKVEVYVREVRSHFEIVEYHKELICVDLTIIFYSAIFYFSTQQERHKLVQGRQGIQEPEGYRVDAPQQLN